MEETSNREVNPEIKVIDDGQEPSKSKSESETIIKVEELFTPRIPRVPPMMRNHENNKGMFDPKRVSIGPYHHGKEDLQLVENIKPMVATLFLQDSGKNMDEVYSMILEKVDDARSYYVKRSIAEYNRKQFAKMMLLDGCFILAIIEDFLSSYSSHACRESKYDDVKNHLGTFLWFSTVQDIFYLVENQLPFQVLELLMSLKFKEDDHDEGMKSIHKLLNFLISKDTRHIDDEEKVDVNETDRESFHLLQLARTKYLNLNKSVHVLESQMGTKKEKDKFQCKQCLKDYIRYLFCFLKKVKFRCMRLKMLRFVKKLKSSKPEYNLMGDVRPFRSVTELKAKGIYLTPNSSLSLEAIEFKSFCFYGRLELHPFMITRETKLFYSNMLAYEMVSSSMCEEDPVITDYINFMRSLIDNQDDVKELRSKHILFNNLGSDQEVANVFKELITFGSSFGAYRHAKEGIQNHYSSTAKTWMAELINKYFSGPWTAIAFVAAACLFVLAFLQTYYTISPHSSHK
ncbi:UPF0481 protein At3g47200-like [Camellia sinensis]|uniref:UPF0481 protein At3g47200-like n=1 Tax=Camellia sinensis TaxID=4442 RepID=UPI001036932E|nr:UPF0481 protein At3g47200-like [Camellia sinensis]